MLKSNFAYGPHNGGFFSCCTVRLYNIMNYYNEHQSLPEIVDSSDHFELYKPEHLKNIHYDILPEYFESRNSPDISGTSVSMKHGSIWVHFNVQFEQYQGLNFEVLSQFVDRYFTPTESIQNRMENLKSKYQIDYEKTCVLFFRGNDKVTETWVCRYDEIIHHAKQVLEKQPGIKFLIQSDETEFIETMMQTFPNHSFYLKDEIRHMPKQMSSVDLQFPETNYEFSKNFLAIMLMISKCKHVIMNGLGNCQLWITLFRKCCEGVRWYELGTWR